MMTLQHAADLLGARATLVGDGTPLVRRVHSDSRSVQPGDLFVALRGENFDGHSYLPQARAAGAAAALAEHGLAEAGLPGLRVDDALAGLQQLSAAWRAALPVQLIAVAGSNGKTTVTQMLGAMLRAWLGEAALATAGNLNNHIGVPLTLLRLHAKHRVGVLELGTNHPGEIALLASLVQPQIALLLNTQREHQEFLQGLDAVARENGSVIEALPATGAVVLPLHDAGSATWRARAAARGVRSVRSFALIGEGAAGTADRADVIGHAAWQSGAWLVTLAAPEGQLTARVAIAGRHNAQNAVAAAAAALAAGVPLDAVRQGLEDFRPVAGRSRSLLVDWQGQPATLVDDAYNANPDSVLAAIDVLAALPGPRWLILGDMAEVGDNGPAFHAEVGRHAALRGIETVWTFGRQTQVTAAQLGGRSARHFDQMNDLLAALPAGPAAASLLVKGSRSMAMERVVQALTGAAAGGAHAA